MKNISTRYKVAETYTCNSPLLVRDIFEDSVYNTDTYVQAFIDKPVFDQITPRKHAGESKARPPVLEFDVRPAKNDTRVRVFKFMTPTLESKNLKYVEVLTKLVPNDDETSDFALKNIILMKRDDVPELLKPLEESYAEMDGGVVYDA